MTREKVRDRVIVLLMEQIGEAEDKITNASRFQEDLHFDSLDSAEMIMGLEDEFELRGIPDEEAAKLTTVGEVIDYICRRLGIGDEGSPVVVTHE